VLSNAFCNANTAVASKPLAPSFFSDIFVIMFVLLLLLAVPLLEEADVPRATPPPVPLEFIDAVLDDDEEEERKK
jgi:hypothetical protein